MNPSQQRPGPLLIVPLPIDWVCISPLSTTITLTRQSCLTLSHKSFLPHYPNCPSQKTLPLLFFANQCSRSQIIYFLHYPQSDDRVISSLLYLPAVSKPFILYVLWPNTAFSPPHLYSQILTDIVSSASSEAVFSTRTWLPFRAFQSTARALHDVPRVVKGHSFSPNYTCFSLQFASLCSK